MLCFIWRTSSLGQSPPSTAAVKHSHRTRAPRRCEICLIFACISLPMLRCRFVSDWCFFSELVRNWHMIFFRVFLFRDRKWLPRKKHQKENSTGGSGLTCCLWDTRSTNIVINCRTKVSTAATVSTFLFETRWRRKKLPTKSVCWAGTNSNPSGCLSISRQTAPINQSSPDISRWPSLPRKTKQTTSATDSQPPTYIYSSWSRIPTKYSVCATNQNSKWQK